MQKTAKNKKGFSLIEIIIYLGIFSIILVSSLNAVFTVVKTYNTFQVMKILRNDAEIMFERLTKEIKLAHSVNISQSILDANPGTLFLNSIDQISESPKTVEFFLDGGALVMRENGGIVKFLISSSTVISNLIFRKIQNASTSQAVKIEVGLSSKKGKDEKSENFYATAILKNSYDK